MTTSGGPTTSGAPPPGTRMIRSANGTTRSSRCSAMTTVRPRSCTRRASALRTSSAAAGSSAEVGSSRTSSRGDAVKHRPDGHTLLLATRESPQRPVAQVLEAEQIDRILHTAAHRIGGHPEVLHRVGQLVLDGLGDEAGQRVLADEADDVGQIARPVVLGRPAVDRDRPRQGPAAEVRDQAVDRPQEGRLARPRLPHDHTELTFGDLEADPVEGGMLGVGVGERDPVERDHVDTPRDPSSTGVPCGGALRPSWLAWSHSVAPGEPVAARALGFGAATAGTRATRIPTTGSRGMLGKARGENETVSPGHVERSGQPPSPPGQRVRTRPPSTRAVATGRGDSASAPCGAPRRPARPRRARRRRRGRGGPARRGSRRQ